MDVSGQSTFREKEILYTDNVPSGPENYTKVINSDLFVQFSREYGGNYIFGMNRNFDEKFRIILYENDFFPELEYSKASNRIFVIEKGIREEITKNKLRVFDTTGLEIADTTITFEKEKCITEVKMHPEGKHLMLVAHTGKKGKNRFVRIFDENLKELFSQEFADAEGKEIINYAINRDGKFCIIFKNAAGSMVYEEYNSDGQPAGKYSSGRKFSGYEEYSQSLLVYYKDKLYTAYSLYEGGALNTIVFEILNNKEKSVKSFTSEVFTKDLVKSMYEKVDAEKVMNPNYNFLTDRYKKPSSLKNFEIVNLLVDDEGLYVVSECLYSDKMTTSVSRKKDMINGMTKVKASYLDVFYAEDIMVSAFTETSGKNIWNSIIGRRTMNHEGMTHKVIRGWSGIQSESYLDKNDIRVVTAEFQKEDIYSGSLYLRRVNRQTGKVNAPEIFVKKTYFYCRNFSAWLDDKHFIFLRIIQKGFVPEFYLNRAEIK
jgi:hypothetical protein